MKRLLLLALCLPLTACAVPKWGNKLTTVILPDKREYKAYVSSDGRMRYKDKDVEFEVDNRSSSLPEELAKAAAYGLTKDATTAAIAK